MDSRKVKTLGYLIGMVFGSYCYQGLALEPNNTTNPVSMPPAQPLQPVMNSGTAAAPVVPTTSAVSVVPAPPAEPTSLPAQTALIEGAAGAPTIALPGASPRSSTVTTAPVPSGQKTAVRSKESKFLRFNFFLEAVPTITKYTVTENSTANDAFQAAMGGAVGFAVYPLDLCHSKKKGFCMDLSIHISSGLGYFFQSQATYFNLFLGADAVFFFGSQRWVGLQVRLVLGYQRYLNYGTAEQGVPPVWQIKEDALDQFAYAFGPGLLINLDSVARGISLYVNTELYRSSSFVIPIGVKIRF